MKDDKQELTNRFELGGVWRLVEDLDYHILPVNGPAHELSLNCWCQPELGDMSPSGSFVVKHHIVH